MTKQSRIALTWAALSVAAFGALVLAAWPLSLGRFVVVECGAILGIEARQRLCRMAGGR